MSCVFYNINGLSETKVSNLFKLLKTTPLVIFLSEPKKIHPHQLDGYSCIHNLSHNNHGIVAYLSTYASDTKILYCSHNCIAIATVLTGKKIIFIGIYNPWNNREKIIG